MSLSQTRRSPGVPDAPLDDDNDDDDYLTMTISEPPSDVRETSIQRRARKVREGENRARVKSKQEREKEATTAREQGLSMAIDESSKGFKIMSKLGYKPGNTLGVSKEARREPIHPITKEDRGGIGFLTEQKRKFNEQVEAPEKRSKLDEGDYRSRLSQESTGRRLEHQLHEAQKVAEALDTEPYQKGEENSGTTHSEVEPNFQRGVNSVRYLKGVKFYWRNIAIENHQLGRSPRSDGTQTAEYLTELPLSDEDSDDDELSQFNCLPVEERLQKVNDYLRGTHRYCFWCKHRYPDTKMEGCPGSSESEHG